ncbi:MULTISPECIES: 1-(5-phosphoribosyl)-5-((5-phosphoribosylamino)methylideneamino)imidazole-4-carboxamide isomerase [Metallosphaera]|uniref:1-(5-phosphoribosyl)-5-[(5-phosphoribosylamino)methylideneamino] imidazole-4-carboxamide isomerase n=1 Tax=Metallosphaera cuprina (strain Ar-4) TaxID=1006006 RepID=F4FZD9_METCR|nr:1-(5-phosphoribosyl)-5-((5-phosphoribosylamino)methylideneamino)imidazole-4-carboxamide isomerase [Metallosphaera cuprina]AEB94448.1 1-(5-phosphoribosyl)-5-[(5-phosphoribosylamino)methylideneamino] imidazole-4-carboxamide [Metallosphaera cuprina Ar-4]
MRVIPSIDISKGNAVKRIRGREGTGLLLGDPLKISSELRSIGYSSVHVVDLDAAEGKGDNLALIKSIIAQGFEEISVGGGIRDRQKVTKLIELGVTKVVMSTLPFTDPSLFRQATEGFQDNVLVAIDYCNEEVLIRGWKESALTLRKAIQLVNSFNVRGVMFTYVCNEGTQKGIDRDVEKYLNEIKGEKGYAGGVGSLEDLIKLRDMGFDYAIVGMSLYGGVIRGVKSV